MLFPNKLTNSEKLAIRELFTRSIDLNPPLKKKKKDSDRITKKDGSGTDDTVGVEDLDKIKKSPY